MKNELADIARRKAAVAEEIRAQEAKLKAMGNALLTPESSGNLGYYFSLFDGILFGYRLFSRIRRFFKKI